MYYSALSRDDIPEYARVLFPFYCDENHIFVHQNYGNMLSQLRKYKCPCIFANQYIEQLSAEFWSAIAGSVGTQMVFRVSGRDAEQLAVEFQHHVRAQDFTHLGQYEVFVRLSIDKVTSRPFTAETLPPPVAGKTNDGLIRYCRERYTTPQRVIEAQVRQALRQRGSFES